MCAHQTLQHNKTLRLCKVHKTCKASSTLGFQPCRKAGFDAAKEWALRALTHGTL
jgi:hypothetical protein